MQPYNPYSAPAARFDASTPQTMRLAYRPVRGMWLKWAYLGVVAIKVVPLWLFIFPLLQGQSPVAVGLVFTVVRGVLWIAWTTIACFWIYGAWEAIPPDLRREVNPASAVGKLFIPFYNLYWMFAVSTGLAEELNRQLVSIGAPPRASKVLAIAGCILHLSLNLARIPALAVISTPLQVTVGAVWFTYMLQCDRSRQIIAENTFED